MVKSIRVQSESHISVFCLYLTGIFLSLEELQNPTLFVQDSIQATLLVVKVHSHRLIVYPKHLSSFTIEILKAPTTLDPTLMIH